MKDKNEKGSARKSNPMAELLFAYIRLSMTSVAAFNADFVKFL